MCQYIKKASNCVTRWKLEAKGRNQVEFGVLMNIDWLWSTYISPLCLHPIYEPGSFIMYCTNLACTHLHKTSLLQFLCKQTPGNRLHQTLQSQSQLSLPPIFWILHKTFGNTQPPWRPPSWTHWCRMISDNSLQATTTTMATPPSTISWGTPDRMNAPRLCHNALSLLLAPSLTPSIKDLDLDLLKIKWCIQRIFLIHGLECALNEWLWILI